MCRFTSPSRISTLQCRSTLSTPCGILTRPLVSKFATLQGAFCQKTKGLQMKCFGWGTDAALWPGNVVTIERTLAGQGWLPNRPAVYTVVVTWCPLDGTHFEPGPGLPRKDDIKTYAKVQAAATFRIVGEPSPASHWEPYL